MSIQTYWSLEIQVHPFFKGIDWEKLPLEEARFKPKLEDEYDTSYFGRFAESSLNHKVTFK